MANVGQVYEFNYTGAEQRLACEKGAYVLEVYGAEGGYQTYSSSVKNQGKGGYAKGTVVLPSATNLYVHVGQKGHSGCNTSTAQPYGGGGKYVQRGTGGAMGGGATDFRLVSGTWSSSSGLLSRILVGGGGGSGAYATNLGENNKPHGGMQGLGGFSASGSATGKGGTQTEGGAHVRSSGYETSGTFGVGGNGSGHSDAGGTGGGGWYGGGGAFNGGGGGSSYILTESSHKPSGYTPTSTYYLQDTANTTGARSGNGYAKATLVAKPPTVSIKSKSNTQVVVTFNYQSMRTTKSKTIRVNWGGTWTTLNTTSASSSANQDITYNLPVNTDGVITFEVTNGDYTTSVSLNIDNTAPVITFPSETYDQQHYEGETVTLFTGSDTNDKDLDYDYKVYVDNQLYTSQLDVKGNTFKLPYFDNMPESYQLKVEVRAKQSSDTTNGTNTDIWSEWYTSPTITIKSPVLFIPNFTSLKWYQDIEQQAILSPYGEGTFETQHYCNGELYTTKHSLGLTPPLLYTPVKPHLWSYEYYVLTRVQNTEGEWSGWYKSPTVEVQFNVQPNDIEFSKELPPYFIQGEVTTIEWGESTDPNATKTTYTASLMNNTTEELLEVRDLEEPRLTFTVPDDIVSNNITFSIVAYSDGLYSNPVSSPKMAITDVKIMDCNLDFPVLNTNVTGQVTGFILEINGDRRISKAENFTDYTIPLHYFRKGENKLTLIAKDRNGVEVTRTWNVNLDFNNTNLIPLDTIEVEGYMSFNYDPEEYYVPCTTLFKNNLDLGVLEHELYGSTPFEGANTITQKLVIKRSANDDLTQLRTLKITGAIE